MQKRTMNQVNLPMPLSGAFYNQVDEDNKGNMTLYERMFSKTYPEKSTRSSLMLEEYKKKSSNGLETIDSEGYDDGRTNS